MADEIIDKINREINIVDLVSEFVKLEKKGKNYFGLCPFHAEDTPSFSVSPERNIALCMGCKEGGAPLTFYSKIKNIPFYEAKKELASRIGITINDQVFKADPNDKYYQILDEAAKFFNYLLFNSKEGIQTIDYLNKRGLDDELIQKFNIGLAPKEKDTLYQVLTKKGYNVSDMINLGLVKQKEDGTYYDLFTNRLMFPILNHRRKTIAFSGRTLSKTDNIKYVNSPESIVFKKGEVLYNISSCEQEIRRYQKVVLFEGFFDLISAYKAGITYSCATMGTALTNNQVDLISKYTKHVVIVYDGDNAGVNATLKAIKLFESKRFKIETLLLKDNLDPDDYIKKYGTESFKDQFKNLLDPISFTYQSILKNKDLTNFNDINEISTKLSELLSDKPQVIIDNYTSKIKKELGIDLVINKSKKPTRVFDDILIYDNLPQKPIQLTHDLSLYLPKFNQAMQILLIEMFKSKKSAFAITEKLKIDLVSEIANLELYCQMAEYYEENFGEEIINVDKFNEKNPNLKVEIEKLVHSLEYKPNHVSSIKKIEKLCGMINEGYLLELKKQKFATDLLENKLSEEDAIKERISLDKQKQAYHNKYHKN